MYIGAGMEKPKVLVLTAPMESPRVLADPVEKFLRTNKVLLFKILKCRKEFGKQVLRLLDLHQMMFDGRTIIAKTVKNLLSITFLFL